MFQGGWALSPDVVHLAAPAVDPEGRKGLAVYRLVGAERGTLERFFALGELRVQAWTDATHVLATGQETPEIWSLDLATGTSVRFEGTKLVANAATTAVVALDSASKPVLLDPVTLAVRARVDRALGKEPRLRFGAGDRLLLLSDETRSLVAALDGTVKLELPIASWEEDRTGLSSRGSYLARQQSTETGAALTVFEVATGKQVFTAPSTLFPGTVVFAPDESYALVSNEPSRAIRVELPSGKTRSIKNGISWDTEAYGYMTASLGITADGRYACGHPVTTIGKYTTCNDQVLFDLRGDGMPKAAHVGCFVRDDGLATLVKLPKSTFGEGRLPVPNTSATYTRLCNSTISPDHSRLALAVYQPPRDPAATSYEQVELLVIRVADASVERVFELGPGPNAMGAVLSHELSPSGRYLHVDWGETSSDYDVVTGEPVMPNAALDGFSDPFRVPGAGERRLVSVGGGALFPLR